MDILQIIDNVLAMKKFIATAKKQGSSIGLVPTMGSLHEGHLSLVKKAQEECDVVVITVCCNRQRAMRAVDNESASRATAYPVFEST